MTYNYKIGYYSHEESNYVELQHDKKFSDGELTEIIAEATLETIKKRKNDGDFTHNFGDIFGDSNLLQCLIEKFGFKLIEYELCWETFGWGSIFDKENWKEDRDDHLDKITESVNNTGFTKKDDDFLNMKKIMGTKYERI